MLLANRTIGFFKPKPEVSFLTSALKCNRVNLEKIYTHPFNQQLFNGTLPSLVFSHYLRDDCFYLHRFALVLKNTTRHTTLVNSDLNVLLNYLAEDIIQGEHSMQLRYARFLDNTMVHKPGSAISGYVDYLERTSLNNKLPVTLCSILPCFWIYKQLGSIWREDALLVNPYTDWINTYSSREFVRATQELVHCINSLGEQSPIELQTQMHQAFTRSVQFEHDFFDEVFTWNLVTDKPYTH